MTEYSEPIDPTLQALQDALEASKRALTILEEAGDSAGALKAARAMADISTKIVKSTPESEFNKPTPNRRRLLAEIYGLIAQALLEDVDRREQLSSSLMSEAGKKIKA